ncbi:MAG: hypothetical protein HQK77_04700 [Desulfobacterales bacterium]|nr:hypothetical protein [Desulfobacterales bacterium]
MKRVKIFVFFIVLLLLNIFNSTQLLGEDVFPFKCLELDIKCTEYLNETLTILLNIEETSKEIVVNAKGEHKFYVWIPNNVKLVDINYKFSTWRWWYKLKNEKMKQYQINFANNLKNIEDYQNQEKCEDALIPIEGNENKELKRFFIETLISKNSIFLTDTPNKFKIITRKPDLKMYSWDNKNILQVKSLLSLQWKVLFFSNDNNFFFPLKEFNNLSSNFSKLEKLTIDAIKGSLLQQNIFLDISSESESYGDWLIQTDTKIQITDDINNQDNDNILKGWKFKNSINKKEGYIESRIQIPKCIIVKDRNMKIPPYEDDRLQKELTDKENIKIILESIINDKEVKLSDSIYDYFYVKNEILQKPKFDEKLYRLMLEIPDAWEYKSYIKLFDDQGNKLTNENDQEIIEFNDWRIGVSVNQSIMLKTGLGEKAELFRSDYEYLKSLYNRNQQFYIYPPDKSYYLESIIDFTKIEKPDKDFKNFEIRAVKPAVFELNPSISRNLFKKNIVPLIIIKEKLIDTINHYEIRGPYVKDEFSPNSIWKNGKKIETGSILARNIFSVTPLGSIKYLTTPINLDNFRKLLNYDLDGLLKKKENIVEKFIDDILDIQYVEIIQPQSNAKIISPDFSPYSNHFISFENSDSQWQMRYRNKILFSSEKKESINSINRKAIFVFELGIGKNQQFVGWMQSFQTYFMAQVIPNNFNNIELFYGGKLIEKNEVSFKKFMEIPIGADIDTMTKFQKSDQIKKIMDDFREETGKYQFYNYQCSGLSEGRIIDSIIENITPNCVVFIITLLSNNQVEEKRHTNIDKVILINYYTKGGSKSLKEIAKSIHENITKN